MLWIKGKSKAPFSKQDNGEVKDSSAATVCLQLEAVELSLTSPLSAESAECLTDCCGWEVCYPAHPCDASRSRQSLTRMQTFLIRCKAWTLFRYHCWSPISQRQCLQSIFRPVRSDRGSTMGHNPVGTVEGDAVTENFHKMREKTG